MTEQGDSCHLIVVFFDNDFVMLNEAQSLKIIHMVVNGAI